LYWRAISSENDCKFALPLIQPSSTNCFGLLLFLALIVIFLLIVLLSIVQLTQSLSKQVFDLKLY
jgi:hypothetical protein